MNSSIKISLVFIVMFMCVSQVFADSMQERRITISASIFPKIIAVDQDLANKLDKEGYVRLAIIYSSSKTKAQKISKIMTRKVKNIAGNKIKIELIDINNRGFEDREKLTGIFFVDEMTDDELGKLVSYSSENNVLLFSPFEGDIERGVMSSIFVGIKIRPYFNVKSMKLANVNLKPALIKVSKTYE